jgi:hypothetical protein
LVGAGAHTDPPALIIVHPVPLGKLSAPGFVTRFWAEIMRVLIIPKKESTIFRINKFCVKIR